MELMTSMQTHDDMLAAASLPRHWAELPPQLTPLIMTCSIVILSLALVPHDNDGLFSVSTQKSHSFAV